ncbi:hypothetical protein VTH06DRAFT_1367 [Thermothelomyces fergusii]
MNSLWPSSTSADGPAGGETPSADTPAEETKAGPTEDALPAEPANSNAPEHEKAPKRPGLQRNHLSVPPPPPPPVPAASPSSSFVPSGPQPDSDTKDEIADDSKSNRDSSRSSRSSSSSRQNGSSSPPAPTRGRQGRSLPQGKQQLPQQQKQQQGQPPQDSISLAQLRRLVPEFPRAEPIAYDYVYTDMAPLEEEVDEWFMYNFWQWVRLNAANRAFYSVWSRLFPSPPPPPPPPAGAGAAASAGTPADSGKGSGGNPPTPTWNRTGDEGEDEAAERKRTFVRALLEGFKSHDRIARAEAVGAAVYLVLGRWTETVKAAGVLGVSVFDGKARSAATPQQLEAMREGVRLVAECGGLEPVWDALRAVFELFWSDDLPQSVQMAAEELINLMTILYVAMQVALDDPRGMAEVRQRLLALNPSLTSFLLQVVVKLRWDETGILPQTQIFLLFWKSILLVFGGSKDLAEAKEATAELIGCDDKNIITASPLDYHAFRQEITSKYPAYVPPQPLLPLEPDQNTIIPPLPNHPTRNNAANGIHPGPPGPGGGASILHQPVHIATPAPSPPPSPGVGGKGGKKQNYQTNQNFPFMYPPLDATSNGAGGKGGAALQDLLVGRKWEGSDVPASILEAGELFSKRVRMSRATRQLWEEREEFLKFERGYHADDDIVDELDLSSLTLEEKEELGLATALDDEPRKPSKSGPDYGPRGVSQQIKERLDAVEEFYAAILGLGSEWLSPVTSNVVVASMPGAARHLCHSGFGQPSDITTSAPQEE